MISLNTPSLNIYPGKIVNAEDICAAFDWAENILSDYAGAMKRPDEFGLLAVPDLKLDLTLAGNCLQVHSLAAVTPGGRIILQHPVKSPKLQLQLSDDLSGSEYFVYVLATSERLPWNQPDSRSHSIHAKYRAPVFELHLKPTLLAPDQFPDALPIGRIVLDKGAYRLDDHFQPPCVHLNASRYMWSFQLDARELWIRMLNATNKIVCETTGVPYNAPLGDLNRFATWVWQYLVAQKPTVLYLRENSHPSELYLLWSGLASVFDQYMNNIAQRPGEILHIMDRYAHGRPGYVFDQQEAAKSARDLANKNYNQVQFGSNFNDVSNFMHQVCMAWIYLGETPEIKWMVEQSSYNLKK